LWDNSCRKEGQTRKGRQGERNLAFDIFCNYLWYTYILPSLFFFFFSFLTKNKLTGFYFFIFFMHFLVFISQCHPNPCAVYLGRWKSYIHIIYILCSLILQNGPYLWT
jgi:hypothetical protein